MVKIGNVEVNKKVVLAPMAGISNSAFRRICKSMGADLVYAEMVSDKAIIYDNEKTKQMLYLTEEERPIAQQIFGSDIESFTESAKIVYEQMKPDIIDINMGCPVPKIAIKSQAGAALLKNPDKIIADTNLLVPYYLEEKEKTYCSINNFMCYFSNFIDCFNYYNNTSRCCYRKILFRWYTNFKTIKCLFRC